MTEHVPVCLPTCIKSPALCLQVSQEIDIHSVQNHKYIIRFYAAFEDLSSVHIAQEYASQGDVYSKAGRAGGILPEEWVTENIAFPLFSALADLHSKVDSWIGGILICSQEFRYLMWSPSFLVHKSSAAAVRAMYLSMTCNALMWVHIKLASISACPH